MKQRLTAAIIGCGRMGAYTRPELAARLPKCWLPLNHAESLSSIDGIDLIACCDPNRTAAETAAQRYGIKAIYSDYQKLVAETRPDIVTVATRTQGRSDIIRFAAENGVKAMHVEKPLCRNLAEGKNAADAVNNNNVAFSYGTLRRYIESYRYALAVVRSGDIGDLVQIIVKHGRTNLLWSHPHSVDIINFFAGDVEVEYVQATMEMNSESFQSNFVDADPIVEQAFIKFKNGMSGVITSAAGLSVEIACTKGGIVVAADGSWLEIRKPIPGTSSAYYTSDTTLHYTCGLSGTQAAITELRDALTLGAKPSLTIDHALYNQRILFGFVLSHMNGGLRFNIKDIADDFTVTGRMGELYA